MAIQSGEALTLTSNVANPPFVLITGSPRCHALDRCPTCPTCASFFDDGDESENVNEEAFDHIEWIPGVGLVRKR